MIKIRQKIRQLKVRYPLWTLLTFLICYKLSQAFISKCWNWVIYRAGLHRRLPSYFSGSIQLFLRLLVILFLMYLIGNMHIFTRRRRPLPGALVPGLYLIMMSLFSITASLINAEGFQSKRTILFSVTYFILVGITEELVYRGVAADILLKTFLFRANPSGDGVYGPADRKAIWGAVLCSGLIFGLIHISNMSHAGVSGVLVQMLGAFLMGMVLVAVYYRTANIYAVIILHAVNDIAAAMPVTILRSDQTISDVISGYGMKDVLLLIPYIAVLLVILRPSKMESIWKFWTWEQKNGIQR